MIAEIRLLLGQLSDDEYRGWLEGHPLFPVARRGWAGRWRLVGEAIAGVVIFGLLLLAFTGLVIITWAAMLPVPA